MYSVYCNWQKCTFIHYFVIRIRIRFRDSFALRSSFLFGFFFTFFIVLLLVVQHFCLEANLH